MTHTPGPWIWGRTLDGEGLGVWATPESYHVLDRSAPIDAEANARLIAAAPDLLAALQHLMRYDFGDSDGAKEAQAAIEKATMVLA